MIFNVLVTNTRLCNKMKDEIFIDYLLVYMEKKIVKKISINSIINFYFHDIRKSALWFDRLLM